MPRTREFDPGQALQAAIRVFWEKGYSDTSVDDVVERSGVAKYGLYGVFGTKRELFDKALAQYAKDRRGDIQRPLYLPEASLPEVRAFFEGVPKRIVKKGHPHGCLINNAAIELGAKDDEVREFVKAFFADLAGVMQGCLRRAVENDELDASTDIGALSRYLVNEFRSALMLSRGGHSRREIESHLEFALKALE